MKITISQNDNIIRVYHSPHDVIVKPKAMKVMLYENGVVFETYDLIEKNLSWLEDADTDCGEILLNLKVK